MKNILFSAIIMAIVLVSCNQKNGQATSSDSTKMDTTEKKYACPMHPEVQGKSTDKCSKCGMDLTKEVK
jgi:hypothetical protein